MTTSPATTHSGYAAEPLAASPTMTGEWRRLGRFLARPALPREPGSSAPLTIVARLYALDFVVMAGLIVIAGIATMAGIELPETALAEMEFTPGLVLLVIIGAPVFEELAFRGWLSGKPGHVLATVIVVAGVAITALTDFTRSDAQVNVPAIATAVATLIGAIAALVLLRGRPAMAWFAKGFALFFWFSTLAFALVHVANFGDTPLVMVLPLVLPQFVIGALLGYLRVNISLWAAILLHAAHNATALGIAMLAMEGAA